MRDIVYLLGRILFAAVFIDNGIGHLTKTDGSAGYAEYKKIPNARLMVQITGVCMVLGGAAVVLGILTDLAGLLLAILVIIFAVMMHKFWEETDPQTQAVERAQFMKNISLGGAGLMLAAIGFIDSYTMTDGVFQP